MVVAGLYDVMSSRTSPRKRARDSGRGEPVPALWPDGRQGAVIGGQTGEGETTWGR